MTLLHSSATRSQPECIRSSQELCRDIILTMEIQDVYRRAVSVSAPTSHPHHSALAPGELRNGPITAYMSCPDRVGTLHHRQHNIYSPLLPKLFLMDR